MAADDSKRRARHEAKGLRGGWRVFLYGVGGLLVTPFLTMLVAWLLYGHRSGWDVGQGGSFIAFLTAVYATPFGAVYWALVAVARNLLSPDTGARLLLLVALPVYLAGVVAALVFTFARYD